MEFKRGDFKQGFQAGHFTKKTDKKMNLKNSKIPQTFPFKIPKSHEATNSSSKYYKNVTKVIKGSYSFFSNL